jgi:hypothetical protein
MGRIAIVVSALAFILAACGSPSYNESAFTADCNEAALSSGTYLTFIDGEVQLKALHDEGLIDDAEFETKLDGEVHYGCSGLRVALDDMNCGQAGADEAIRQLEDPDVEDIDFEAIADTC